MPNDQTSASDAWRPLLEAACRDTLHELARSADGLKSGRGAPRSIESVVKDVTARVFAESGLPKVMSNDLVGGQAVEDTSSEPLLADVTGSPWVVWHEATGRRLDREEASVKTGSNFPTESMGGVLPAQPGPRFTDILPRAGRVRGELEDRALATTEAMQFDRSSMLPQTVLGQQPIVVRNGLTIETHTAEHLVMQWQGRPKSVLIVAKKNDCKVTSALQDIAVWLSSQGIVVVLEPSTFADNPGLKVALSGTRTFSSADALENSIDFVITIGGDGTLTWAVSLFQRAMPPVLSLAAGSLGFLTPFPLRDWVHTLTPIFDVRRPREPLPLVCRMRLRVTVRRGRDSPLAESESRAETLCLNEVLIHRGRSGALSKLDLAVDGEHVTIVQGDGVILATPTGSTAYSLAAGGSMAHPAVPAILLTPVSPHSLSFRPAVLPDCATVTIGVPASARAGAALSVDGKDICELGCGDSVDVAASLHPVPTICRETETKDWFGSVHEALQWNGRADAKL